MELSKERINEIAYALLLATLSKQDMQLDPEQFKRKFGNFSQKTQYLPKQFKSITAGELQVAAKVICHDLVDYAFGFTLTRKKRKG